MTPLRSLPLLLGIAAAASLVAQDSETGGGGRRPMPMAPQGARRVYIAPSGGSTAFHREIARPVVSRRIIPPRPLERCMAYPDYGYWHKRDLMKEIQAMSRSGFIPVVPVAGDVDSLNDVSYFPSGWKAYGFVVPAHGELEVRLTHPAQGWFRLVMVNKWGSLQEGMLQNIIPKGDPIVTFKNPRNSSQEVFVIADDPGWMSSTKYPYTITVKRNWDSKAIDPKTLPETVGIWAKHGSPLPKGGEAKDKATPEPTPAPTSR